MKYISTIYLCAAVSIISSAFYCRQHLFTVHGWSHEWELKQITFWGGTQVLRVLAVFREYMLRALEISTGSTRLILWALQPLRIVVLRELLVLGVLYYSSYSHIWAFSTRTAHILPARAVFRTPLTRVLQYTQQQQYPQYRTPQYCQQRQHRKKSIEHHTYEHTVPGLSNWGTSVPTVTSIEKIILTYYSQGVKWFITRFWLQFSTVYLVWNIISSR